MTLATPDHDDLSILLSLKERFRPDGSHDDVVTSHVDADTSLRCKCGNLLTIVDSGYRCRQCTITQFRSEFGG